MAAHPTHIRIINDDEDYDRAVFYDNGNHWIVMFCNGSKEQFKLRVNLSDLHIVNSLLSRYEEAECIQCHNYYPLEHFPTYGKCSECFFGPEGEAE